LAFDRDRRPASVDEWLEAIQGAEGRKRGKGIITSLVAAAAVVAVGVVGWMMMSGGTQPSITQPAIAVLPFRIGSTLDSAMLGPTLGKAFEDQLNWLPEYRVVSAGRVQDSIVRQFGAAQPDLDTLIRYVAGAFDASEVLWGRVEEGASGQLQFDVQVRARDGTQVLGTASRAGPVDSLSAIVLDMVLEAFAERVVAERTGWSAALPSGLEAVNSYYDGDTRFRRGQYDLAIERFREVIERDTAFAYGHFKLMLAEVLNLQPTQAATAVRSALGTARQYEGSLDPTTRDLLEGYEILVAEGDIQRALEVFQGIVERNPEAVDAWFVLGYLQINFAAMLGTAPEAAGYAFRRANELDPEFVATIAQLFRIAVLEGRTPDASRYAELYVAIDSTSPTAETIRMVDSAVTGGTGDQIRVMGSFGDRSAIVLETVAISAGEFFASGVDREGALAAIEALWRRATTARDRTIAFRMKMAVHLGAGQVGSARALLNEARRGPMRISQQGQNELDSWIVLSAVMGTGVTFDDRETETAAQRLVRNSDDAVSQWLVSRWYSGRDERVAREAAERLRALASSNVATPLERSLASDLDAVRLLAAGDTATALSTWAEATRRYNIGEVYLGLVGSLWPLQLERARVAAAAGDSYEVLAATACFRHMPGFIDQVAWVEAWPIRARALVDVGDVAAAREAYAGLQDLLDDADGEGVAIRDSVEVWLEQLPTYQRVSN
jgi:tetratricopeptide (TPR) repeat protein